MAADIYIVSGFLGAGKTTLIQKLLKEAFNKDRVVLIENDFGEVSVDAALLKSGGTTVKEINSGCICCSLQGDFVESIIEIEACFKPDKIIIEPSGIAKLSDIIKACTHSRISPDIEVKEKITVVDTEYLKIFLEDFGEFYEDQIKNADVILLSHTEDFQDKITEACKLIRHINPQAFVFSKSWEEIGVEKLLSVANNHKSHEIGVDQRDCSGSEDNEQPHSGHHHHHDAKDIFDTVTLFTEKIFTDKDLRAGLMEIRQIHQDRVLRVKGIVSAQNGYLNLQYTPGDLQITKTSAEGNFICIIGKRLNKQELVRIFNKTNQ
jgi:G3E family GTPase